LSRKHSSSSSNTVRESKQRHSGRVPPVTVLEPSPRSNNNRLLLPSPPVDFGGGGGSTRACESGPAVAVQHSNNKTVVPFCSFFDGPGSVALARFGYQSTTDKISSHHYQRWFGPFLEPLRHQTVDASTSRPLAMFEVGIAYGAGLKMWLDFFSKPHWHIYGLDLGCVETSPASSGPRFKLFGGDQSDLACLERVTNHIREVDGRSVAFINDDGSHFPPHVFATFNYLFVKMLIPGGVYIIEDVETSYWGNNSVLYGNTLNFGIGHSDNVVSVFQRVADFINKDFVGVSFPDVRDRQALYATLLQTFAGRISESCLLEIHSVTFGRNCIIIHKKPTEFFCPHQDFLHCLENHFAFDDDAADDSSSRRRHRRASGSGTHHRRSRSHLRRG
jgi:hypothetical protein